MSDTVEHPAHYGGEDDPYEVIKVAEAWGFDGDAYLFNVLKYIRRDKDDRLEDLEKALFYLKRKIQRVKETAALGAQAIPELVLEPASPHSRLIHVRVPGFRSHTHYAIRAHNEWLLETLASLVATGSKQKDDLGPYVIAVRPNDSAEEPQALESGKLVGAFLDTFPPEDYEYFLERRR